MSESKLIDGENPGPERLRQMGELTYLFFRSGRHDTAPLNRMRRIIQPPVDLDQVVIFREKDTPRCAITWAFFSDEAEQKFLAGQAIEPSDWRSGQRMWVIDMVSTFHNPAGSKAARWFLKNIPSHIKDLCWIREGTTAASRRIVVLKRKNARWGVVETRPLEGK